MKNRTKRDIKINSKDAIGEIYNLLKESVIPENIRDLEFLKDTLEQIISYKNILSDEEYSEIEHIVNAVIIPPYLDENYFGYIYKKEFGAYNTEGEFVPNSKESFESMLDLIFVRSLRLSRQIDAIFRDWLSKKE